MIDRIKAQQDRRKARRILGLCIVCGVPTGVAISERDLNVVLPPAMCERHRELDRKRKRKALNLKPWRVGKRGRPPIV
jgi:hypothetical protein